MKRIVLTLCVLIVSFSLFASNAQIINYDSTLYGDIDDLYLLEGLPSPSSTRPWSASEARLIFEKVNKDNYTGVKAFLRDRVEKELSGLRFHILDDAEYDISALLSPEGYFHPNSDFNTETDWFYDYNKRASLLKVDLELSLWNNFYVATDLHYRYSRADWLDEFEYYKGSDKISSDGYVGSYKIGGNAFFVKESYFFREKAQTNITFDIKHFDFYWPRRAIMSVGGNNWNLSLNRDKLKIGNAYFGNLLVDDKELSDSLKLTFFSKNVKFDFVSLFMPVETSDGQDELLDESRMFLFHALTFNLFNKASFVISENVTYKYKSFDISNVNPGFIYHNLNNRAKFNAILYLEANVAILPSLTLYGQYIMDQAKAPLENGYQEDSSGFILGVKSAVAFKKGVLKPQVEFAFTNPLLYRRDLVDFIRVTRDEVVVPAKNGFNIGGGLIPYFSYIGFPYGGDAIVLNAKVDYKSMEGFYTSLYFQYAKKGEMNIFRSHSESGKNEDMANYMGSTPSGNITKNFIVIGLYGDYDFSSLFSYPIVKVYAEGDCVIRWEHNKSENKNSQKENDFQFTFGVSVKV